MTMKDQAAVVGIGATPLYRRGASYPQESELSLACKAVLAACEDAGIAVADIDGFANYSGSPRDRRARRGARRAGGALHRGHHRWRRRVRPPRSGSRPPRSTRGSATTVLTLLSLQQATRRLGGSHGERVADLRAGEPRGVVAVRRVQRQRRPV